MLNAHSIFSILPIILFALSLGPAAATPVVDDGATWLAARQDSEGCWKGRGERPSLHVTALATLALVESGADGEGVARAVHWLRQQRPVSRGAEALRLEALVGAGAHRVQDLARTWAGQRADGPWSHRDPWEADLLETSRALAALGVHGDLVRLAPAASHVVQAQQASGGWGTDVDATGASIAHVHATAHALLALLPAEEALQLSSEVDAGVTWLLQQEVPGGGFGDDGVASIGETALALRVLVDSHRPTDGAARRAADWLAGLQQPDGSWNQSALATALAMRALVRDLPNLKVDPDDLILPVAPVLEGDDITLEVTIHNSGPHDAEGVIAQFHDGDPDAGGQPIGDDPIVVGAVAAGTSVSATTTWDTTEAWGGRDVHVVIDLDGAELRTDDNRQFARLEVLARPNLLIDAIEIVPETPRLGEELTIRFAVQNTGGVDITQVEAEVWDGEPSVGTRLSHYGPLTIDANSQQEFLSVGTLTAGLHECWVRTWTTEPGLQESDPTDNEQSTSVVVADGVDLRVDGTSIQVSDETPEEGDLVEIAATVWNAGTTDQASVVVRFFDGRPEEADTFVGEEQLSILAGESAIATVSWHTLGHTEAHALHVVVDPDDVIAEDVETNNRAARAVDVFDRPDYTLTPGDYHVYNANGTGYLGTNTPITEGQQVVIYFYLQDDTIENVPTWLDVFVGDPDQGGTFLQAHRLTDQGWPGGFPFATWWRTDGHSGPIEIHAVSDPDDEIVETDESNNRAVMSLTIAPEDAPNLRLESTDILVDPRPLGGSIVQVEALVSNTKRHAVDDPFEVSFYLNDIDPTALIGTRQVVPSLGGHGVAAASVSWDTTGLAGRHDIHVVVDESELIVEKWETDNAATKSVRVHLAAGGPTDLLATASGPSEVDLTWQAATAAVDGYLVYRDGRLLNAGRNAAQNAIAEWIHDGLNLPTPQAVDGSCTWVGVADHEPLLEVTLDAPTIVQEVRLLLSAHLPPLDIELYDTDTSTTPVHVAHVAGSWDTFARVEIEGGIVAKRLRIRDLDANRYDVWSVHEIEVLTPELITSTSYQDTNVTPGVHSHFVVGLTSALLHSPPSNTTTVAVVSDASAPAQPADADVAVGPTENHRLVSWTANSEPDLAGHRIYRSRLNVAAAERGAVAFGDGGSDPWPSFMESHGFLNDGHAEPWVPAARVRWREKAPLPWWQAPKLAPEWLGVRLAGEHAVSAVRIHLPRDESRQAFLLQSSLDGVWWTTLADYSASPLPGGVHEVTVDPPVSARFIRLLPTLTTGVGDVAEELRVLELEVIADDLAPLLADAVVPSLADRVGALICLNAGWSVALAQEELISLAFSVLNLEPDRDRLIVRRLEDDGSTTDLDVLTGRLGPTIAGPYRARRLEISVEGGLDATSRWRLESYRLHSVVSGTSHADVLLTDGTYTYGVSALDLAGNESPLAVAVPTVLADSLPPSAPVLVECSVQDSVADLTWQASTSVDVAGYRVHRQDGSGPFELRSGDELVLDTHFVDGELVTELDATWRVTAVDHEGQESAGTDCSQRPLGIDLVAGENSLLLFPPRPSVADDVRLVAVVRNPGDGTPVLGPEGQQPDINVAENVAVTFYAGGTLIGQDVIARLPQGSTALAVTTWSPTTAGSHALRVVVDELDSVEELDGENNEAERTVDVTATPALQVTPSATVADDFPTVSLTVGVSDRIGGGVFDLEASDFEIDEGGAPAEIVSVVPLNEAGGAPPPVDVVFIGDSSASMGGEWNVVEALFPVLDELLESSRLDVDVSRWRMGACCSTGLAHQAEDEPMIVNAIYHGEVTDATGPGDLLCRLSIQHCVSEAWGPVAAFVAQDDSFWRPGARRFLVPFADEGVGPWGWPLDLAILDEDIAILRENGVIALPLFGLDQSAWGVHLMNRFGTETGGAAFPCDDPFRMAEFVHERVAREPARYRVELTSPSPTRDGSQRELAIRVTHGTATGAATTEYRAPFTPLPDLAVESVTADPAIASAGDTITVATRIVNRGGVWTPVVAVGLEDGGIVGERRSIVALAPGGSQVIELEWSSVAGSRDVLVVADPDGSVAEVDENNNSAVARVDVSGAPSAELTVAARLAVQEPAAPFVGQAQTVTVPVLNRGTVDAGDVTVQVVSEAGSSDEVLVAELVIDDLPAGASERVTFSWDVSGLEGLRALTVTVDPFDEIQEIREDDNRAVIAVDVLGSGLKADLDWPIGLHAPNADTTFSLGLDNTSVLPFAGRVRVEVLDSEGDLAAVALDEPATLGAATARGRSFALPANASFLNDVTDALARADVDFGAALGTLGVGGSFAPDSVVVTEIDESGNHVARLESRFLAESPGASRGTVRWRLPDRSFAGSTRHFLVAFDTVANGPYPVADPAAAATTRDDFALSIESGEIFHLSFDEQLQGRERHLGDLGPLDYVDALEDAPNGLELADFDADGELDLFVAGRNVGQQFNVRREGAAQVRVSWSALEGGAATTDLITDDLVVNLAWQSEVADLNGDGLPDVIVDVDVPSRFWHQLYAFLSNGDRTFRRVHLNAVTPVWSGCLPRPENGFAAGDLDADGLDDLILACPTFAGERLHAWRNTGLDADGLPTFTHAMSFAAGLFDGDVGAQVVAEDFNEDGKLDLAAFRTVPPLQGWMFPGLGDGTFGAAIETSGWARIAWAHPDAADVDGDGHVDLLTTGVGGYLGVNVESVLVNWKRGLGDGTFEEPRPLHGRVTPLQTIVASRRSVVHATPHPPVAMPSTRQAWPSQTWNTGALAAGDYRARVVLEDARGREFEPDRSDMTVRVVPAAVDSSFALAAVEAVSEGAIRLESLGSIEVAAGRPTTSSLAHCLPHFAVDGDLNSAWWCTGWMEIDLESERLIDQVEVWNLQAATSTVESSRSGDWTFDHSLIGASYWPPYDGTVGGEHHQAYQLDLPSASRFIRLHQGAVHGNGGLREVKAYETQFVQHGSATSPILFQVPSEPEAKMVMEMVSLGGRLMDGTTLVLRARAGDAGTVDASWTDWLEIQSNAPLPAELRKEFIQLAVDLASSSDDRSPALHSLDVRWRTQPRWPFEIDSHVAASCSVAPSRRIVAAREDVDLLARVENASANAPLEGLALQLEISDPAGTLVHSEGRFVSTMPIGARRDEVFSWNTGVLAPGEYDVMLTASWNGQLLASCRDAVIIEADPLAQLVGSVDASPGIVQGGPGADFTVEHSVRNAGNQAISGLDLKVQAVHVDSGQVAFEDVETGLALGIDGVHGHPLPSEKDSLGLAAGDHRVLLIATLGGEERVLASSGFRVVDSAPPVIAVTSPVDPSYWDVEITVDATVTDDGSGVERVEHQLDGTSGWTGLSLTSGDEQEGSWSGSIDATALAEGEHELEVRAFDHAGHGPDLLAGDDNPVLTQRVFVDHTDPEIEIVGLPGTCTNEDVTITLTFSDNLALDESTRVFFVNGEDHVGDEGVPIVFSNEATYVLEASVSDRVGRSASREDTWGIDREPYAIAIELQPDSTDAAFATPPSYPRNDQFYDVSVAWSVSFDDAHRDLGSEAVLVDGVEVGETEGLIEEEGVHQVSATAADACGNPATSVESMEFVIDRTEPEIVIDGVEEGQIYYSPVSIDVQVDDLHPNGQTITLNGSPYVPGTPVDQSGDYVLEVVAEDLAGNVAELAIPFTFHRVDHEQRIAPDQPRVLLGFDGFFPGEIEQALLEGGVHVELADGIDDVVTRARSGSPNVLMLHRASQFGLPTLEHAWSESMLPFNSCADRWEGLAEMDSGNDLPPELVGVIGAERGGPLPVSGEPIKLTPSPISSVEQSIPFAGGSASINVPAGSDAVADLTDQPVVLIEDALAPGGRTASFAADLETAWHPEFAEIVRDTVQYVTPMDQEPLASHLVVSVLSSVTNAGPIDVEVTATVDPSSTLELIEILPPAWPPSTSRTITVPAGETRPVVAIVRLPPGVGSSGFVTTRLFVDQGVLTEISSRTLDMTVAEDLSTAFAATESALELLADQVFETPDAPHVEQAQWHVSQVHSDDGSPESAEQVISQLIEAHVTLGNVQSADWTPTCRELVRLLRYWRWEWAAR